MTSERARRSWSRHPTSAVLHALDGLTSRSWVAGTVVVADLLWVALSVRFEFPPRLETVFQTMVAAVTLAMVFVIQHTARRQQAVTQRKLDEILSSLPRADKSVINLETAPDEHVVDVGRRQQAITYD